MKLKLFFLSTLITYSSFSSAFTLGNTNSNLEGFSQRPVQIYLNPTQCPSDIETYIQEAIDLWNSIATSNIELSLVGTTTATAANLRFFTFNESIVIACSTDFATDSASSLGGDGCSGSCLESVPAGARFSTGQSNIIQRAYLILNMNSGVGGQFSTKSSEAKKIILAHEIGHTLGLGHSGNPSALMHYSIALKTSLNLHQDDIDGISYLYPKNELSGDTILGCGTLRFPKDPTSWGLNCLIMFLPVLFLSTLRFKKLLTFRYLS